jgi:D-alanyl-lipoteichoic acid acyltransferase DltB (MBOAT superfamily)
MAIGSARIFGFDLMDNFRSPYLAMNIKEFWRRWHISLTTWFTDYLYIPLGGNRKGKNRKYLNTMIVFLVSGLWHGASWNYVVWGGLNGLFLILHDVTENFRTCAKQKLNIEENSIGHRFFSTLFTFCLVNITWVFFRAPSFHTALTIGRHTLAHFHLERMFSSDFLNSLGISNLTAVTMGISLLLLLVVDILRYKSVDVGSLVRKQGTAFRWMVYIGLLLMILVFGIYGADYEQTEFLYFQF